MAVHVWCLAHFDTGNSTLLFSLTFLAFDMPENRFSLQEAGNRAARIIGGLVAKSIIEISPSTSSVSEAIYDCALVSYINCKQNLLGQVVSRVSSYIWPPSKKPCYPFLSVLTATGRPIDELVGNIIGITVGASVNFAHAAVNVIDFYLDDARAEERLAIVKLVATKSPESDALLSGYVREAMRELSFLFHVHIAHLVSRSTATIRWSLETSYRGRCD